MKDEILAEIHAIKDASARKYRAEFAGMMNDLRQRQERSGRRIIRLKGNRAPAAEGVVLESATSSVSRKPNGPAGRASLPFDPVSRRGQRVPPTGFSP